MSRLGTFLWRSGQVLQTKNKYLIECFVLFLFRHSIYCYAVEVDSIENLLSPIMARTEKQEAYFKPDNKPAVQRLSGVLWFLRV